MFDLGWTEILVIAIVLIVVVGPKDLPRMLRTFGRTTSTLRTMAGDFRKQFDEALKEAELDDVKDLASSARKLDPRSELKKHLSPLQKAGEEVRAGLDKAMKPTSQAPQTPASSVTHAAEPVKTGATNTPGEKPAETKQASKANGAAKPPSAKKTAATGKPAAKKPATAKSTAATKATPARKTSGAAKPARKAGGKKAGIKT